MGYLIQRCCLTIIRIPIIKTRRSHDILIYIVGILDQGLALLTLSWDKNWDSHSLVNGYPSFYPRIALVAPSPGKTVCTLIQHPVSFHVSPCEPRTYLVIVVNPSVHLGITSHQNVVSEHDEPAHTTHGGDNQEPGHCAEHWPTDRTSWHGNLSALLAFCEGNPPVTMRWHKKWHKGLVMRSSGVFFDVSLDMLLNKQWNCRGSETPWRSCDITELKCHFMQELLVIILESTAYLALGEHFFWCILWFERQKFCAQLCTDNRNPLKSPT